MDIAAVAGFVGGWTLFHDVLPNAGPSISAESIRAAAVNVDVPVGDSINGGGVKFAGPGALDEGQSVRAAAVVGQWQAVGVKKILLPPPDPHQGSWPFWTSLLSLPRVKFVGGLRVGHARS